MLPANHHSSLSLKGLGHAGGRQLQVALLLLSEHHETLYFIVPRTHIPTSASMLKVGTQYIIARTCIMYGSTTGQGSRQGPVGEKAVAFRM